MERGYSLTYNQDGEIVKSINSVDINDTVQISLIDGNLKCQSSR